MNSILKIRNINEERIKYMDIEEKIYVEKKKG